MIELRAAQSDEDLEAWASVKSAVAPNQPVTAEQLRTSYEEGRLLLLAEAGGEPVGCIAAPSHFNSFAFAAARVLPGHRGSGGAAHLAAHNGLSELITWTQRGNEGMQALNRRLGYVDTSRSITFQGPLPSSG
jgi:hypothetical protein